MRRRGTNIFALIGKSVFENSAGRIRWRSNMWALVSSQWDKNRLFNPNLIGKGHINRSVNEKGEFETDGRVLVKKPCTLCPSAPGDDFYFDGKWSWVPAVACRKCHWHRPSGRGGFRFPRCTYKRPADLKGVAVNTLTQIKGMVEGAVKQAEEVVKGDV